MFNLTRKRNEDTRSITAENKTGEESSGGQATSNLGRGRKGSPSIRIPQGERVTIAEISGPGEIRHIWMTVRETTDSGPFVLRDIIIRFFWDDESNPSVECPLGDFFCSGFAKHTAVNSLPVVVIPAGGMNCFFSMPFCKNARIEIENQHPGDIEHFFYQIDYALLRNGLPDDTLYFHATWRREKITELKRDYVILDGVAGSGHYVGTYLALAPLERNWYGEGEVKFYIDDDTEFPTICGTGLEDYFGGAWAFGGAASSADEINSREEIYNTPFLGHPYMNNVSEYQNNSFKDDFIQVHSFYRWHLTDPVCFNSKLRVTLQQIGFSPFLKFYERQDDLASVGYWYQTEDHLAFPELLCKEKRWPR